jgi:arylsulfatase A-like enzyme
VGQVIRLRRLLLVATCGALLTASGELAVRAVEKAVLHRYIYLSHQAVWLTPAADLLLFVFIAGIIAVVAKGVPNAGAMRPAATTLAFASAMSILALQPWLAWWAMLPLAVGIALRVGRIVADHEAGALRFARRATPVLAGMVVLLALAVNVRSLLRERQERAAPVAPPGSPNVLIIVWDAVRAEDVGLYGFARATTPNLAVLGARGVVFDRAMSTGPYTLPGHAGLFTGRWAHELDASWLVPLDPGVPTLAGALGARGWRTGAFSANHLFVTGEHGLLRGFGHSEDYALSPAELARSSALVKWLLSFDRLRAAVGWPDVPGRRDARDIRERFTRWLERDRSRPFFAFLNLFDAHDPYLPPPPFDAMYLPADEVARARANAIGDKLRLSAADAARQRDLYDGAIAWLDEELRRTLDDLRIRGLLDSTLVIVVGDHGEEFGEHGAFSHGSDVYLPAVHVPLVMALPARLPPGRRVTGVASLRDVPATVAEVLGIGGAAWPLPGRSLSRLWRSGGSDTLLTEVDRLPRGGLPWFPVRRGNVRSIIAWPYQLITTADSVELFDLGADPWGLRNLQAEPGSRGTRDSLRVALSRWRRGARPTKL